MTWGCTDRFAYNYNPYATADNGSCAYEWVSNEVEGCIDPGAVNFDPVATVDNGKCVYVLPRITSYNVCYTKLLR